MQMYPNIKIYGPYLRKDGRKHLTLVYSNGRKTSLSYPKYLMECFLGRYLTPDETVDHIDRDFTNDDILNLQVLTRSDHTKLDATRIKSQSFVCPVCSIEFLISGKKMRDAHHNRLKGKSGPYCSKSCAGIDSHNSNRITSTVIREYYKLIK